MVGAGDATNGGTTGEGRPEVASQAHSPLGFAVVVELHAVVTTPGSVFALRATTAMRTPLILLRLATVGAAQAPLASTHWVTWLELAAAETPYCTCRVTTPATTGV